MNNPDVIDKLDAPAASTPASGSARPSIHIYSAGMQPATNFVDKSAGKPMRFRCKPNALRPCSHCRKKHRAKNMLVQVYYDSIRYWCKDDQCHKH